MERLVDRLVEPGLYPLRVEDGSTPLTLLLNMPPNPLLLLHPHLLPHRSAALLALLLPLLILNPRPAASQDAFTVYDTSGDYYRYLLASNALQVQEQSTWLYTNGFSEYSCQVLDIYSPGWAGTPVRGIRGDRYVPWPGVGRWDRSVL